MTELPPDFKPLGDISNCVCDELYSFHCIQVLDLGSLGPRYLKVGTAQDGQTLLLIGEEKQRYIRKWESLLLISSIQNHANLERSHLIKVAALEVIIKRFYSLRCYWVLQKAWDVGSNGTSECPYKYGGCGLYVTQDARSGVKKEKVASKRGAGGNKEPDLAFVAAREKELAKQVHKYNVSIQVSHVYVQSMIQPQLLFLVCIPTERASF